MHATHRIDEFFKALEVNFHIMMNGNTEVGTNGTNEHVGTQAVGRIDAILFLSVTNGHIQVTRKRHECRSLRNGVVAQNHDGVAALATEVVAHRGVVGVIGVNALTAIGAHQQIVFKTVRWRGEFCHHHIYSRYAFKLALRTRHQPRSTCTRHNDGKANGNEVAH